MDTVTGAEVVKRPVITTAHSVGDGIDLVRSKDPATGEKRYWGEYESTLIGFEQPFKKAQEAVDATKAAKPKIDEALAKIQAQADAETAAALAEIAALEEQARQKSLELEVQ